MLDSRTSLPAPRVDRAAPHAKGASLSDAFAARQPLQGDLSFDSVLSSTLSDRRAMPRPEDRAPAADAPSPVQPRQSSRRKTAQREQGTGASDPSGGATQAQAQPGDPPDQAATDTRAADSASPSPSVDAPANGSQKSADAQASPDADEPQAAAGEGAVQAMAAANVSSAAAATATSERAEGVAGKSQKAAGAGAGLAPLQWMARQQAAKVNVRTAPPATLLPQSAELDGGDAQAQAAPASSASGKQAGPAGAQASVQQLIANVLAPAKSVSDAIGVLKTPQDKAADALSIDPSAPATQAPLAGGHSVTADPTGLLNPADMAASAAMPQMHPLQPTMNTAAASVSGMELNAGLLVPADDAAQNMQRLAAMVHATMGQGQSVTRMQLQPPELGAVTAVMQLRQNKMDLKLEVANESARDIVTGGLGRLRESLQQQGISLDRATVSVAPRNEHAAGDQQQSAWTGQQGHASGQFHPGHDGQPGDRTFTTSFAVDVPVAGTATDSDAAVAAAYVAGLNVLA